MKPIKKLVLVGCGAVAELYHAPALQQAESAGWLEVAGLVDPSSDRLNALRALFPSAQAVATLGALKGDFDLGIVASPVRFHAEQTIELLKSGCTVLCEKPLCLSASEAASMAEAASRAGRAAVVGLFRRFFPTTEQIRSLASGATALGRPLWFHAEEGGPFAWPAASASFFSKETAGGGVLMDIGSHLLDLLSWWFGEVETFAYWDDAYGGVECNSFGRLRYACGVEGTFRLSWDLPTSNEYVIGFENGTIRWGTGVANRLAVVLDGAAYVHDCSLAEGDPRRPLGVGVPGRGYLAAFTAQLHNLCAVASGDEQPRVALKDGVANLSLIERLYEGRQPWIPSWFSAAEAEAIVRVTGGVQ